MAFALERGSAARPLLPPLPPPTLSAFVHLALETLAAGFFSFRLCPSPPPHLAHALRTEPDFPGLRRNPQPHAMRTQAGAARPRQALPAGFA